jgi:hypothetical protein
MAQVQDGTGKTEFWNGTSWTEVNDLATARRGLGSGTGSHQAHGLFLVVMHHRVMLQTQKNGQHLM